MTEDGKGVNYAALKGSEAFQQYILITQQLRLLDLHSLNEEEKKAFFINTYNALTLHGLASRDTIPQSVLEVDGFWKTTAYNIGGFEFSLDDIEHGILRANSPHPTRPQPQFGTNDPRSQFTVKTRDPRVHFALVCGGKSCPAINVYSSKNLERALNTASKSFCQQEIQVEESKKQVTLSKIFQWYMIDFAQDAKGVIRWVLPFLTKEQQEAASHLLDDPDLKISYSDYDWQLNKLGAEQKSP
ncbi:uncharacterized protein LOC102359383 isoform X2 [Latimeria chalumnae]|nr:PREDICTED: uncharacterized protein LOC102359383 isoform X2 [Latimeria chalumnae]XP_014340750.1 PREDICTED: uncharacterized protein LOC102359383 isoform X2 [Latimeria chalumnae]|eukprot:XP_014340749.1 PREDICTED: uncharacterized protein LOC102359383 isoform X2 [Latimeria chalumnae]